MNPNEQDQGDRTEQFVRLLGAHEQQLLAYVLAMVPDWHAAQDIAQATRVKLWRQFDEFDTTKSFGAWSRAIAHYEILHYRNLQSREKMQFNDQLLALIEDEASRAADQTDARHSALLRCVESLSEIQQRLVMGCYLGDKTPRQVAEEEGRTYEAVRKSLLRIRQSLHRCVERTLRLEAHG